MTRRDFLNGVGGACFVTMSRAVELPINDRKLRSVKFGVITDLHHGLAPDALARFRTFVDTVKSRPGLDFAIQLGDFVYGTSESAPCIETWKEIEIPRFNVLGNHDMDKCDKDGAMRATGMNSRYGAHSIGGYRFVTLDLNHFKKRGTIEPYSKGNYFTDNATHNWADEEQLSWLDRELRTSSEPVILISHQPLGFREIDGSMPAEQIEVMKVVTEAKKANPEGAVVLCMFGHLHVDRLEHHEGIPCLCVNSASYFWSEGMYAYKNPLFAFMELRNGQLIVEGASGAFAKTPPRISDVVVGRSAAISSRSVSL